MQKIAFIPIRKGSKWILNKNIKILGVKPLVCFVLDTISDLTVFDEIWVGTDSIEAIELINKRYGKK